MKKMLAITLTGITLLCSISVLAGDKSAKDKFPEYTPLIPVVKEWKLGEYWTRKKIGNRDFYFAEMGPYVRLNDESIKKMKQVGFYDKIVPGHFNFKWFDPETYKGKAPSYRKKYRELADEFLKNRWPLHTIQYCLQHDNPPPTEKQKKLVEDLWMGDGVGEESIYRPEPLFAYIKGDPKIIKRWNEFTWAKSKNNINPMDVFYAEFFKILEKEMPFFKDKNHQWTRRELKKLYNLWSKEWFKKVGKGTAWGMFLSPYYLGMQNEIDTVVDKNFNAFVNAQARGIIRQSGGNKFLYSWMGHEPTERYAYFYKGRIIYHRQDRDAQGMPYPQVRYHLFKPFLYGSNYMVVECIPGSLVQDIEGDGQYELSTLGQIYKSLIDFSERHPDRGTPYASVALLRDAARGKGTSIKGLQYMGFKFPRFDDADYMNEGLLRDLIFQHHRDVRQSSGTKYSIISPYGEIFDILAPNQPGIKIDPKIFDGYKVLFGLGGLEIDKDYAKILTDYVENGGTLVLNINDIGKDLDPAMFGVKILPDILKGSLITNTLTGKKFKENEFTFQKVTLDGAKALYTSDGQPIVTRFKFGKGYTMLVTCNYMIQDKQIKVKGRHGEEKKKPLLNFVDNFIESLTTGLTPFEIRRKEKDKADLTWLINKKGDGWTVTVLNYSLKREELVSKPMGTARVFAEYPYKEIPFEIVCKAPIKDVMELYEDRDVHWKMEDGKAVVSETIRGGDVKVYEFQPHKIKLKPRKRSINYALNRPVKASSTLKRYFAETAVDGSLNNDEFWQSDLDPRRHYYFDMPQWLQVDLGGLRTVDHAFVLFHTWPQSQETLKTRQRIYQYVVEVSAEEDPKNWVTVIDESKNIDPARAEGLERWFKPVEAHHARLRLLRNCSGSGAQVVEFKVMGPEQETYTPERKPLPSQQKIIQPDDHTIVGNITDSGKMLKPFPAFDKIVKKWKINKKKHKDGSYIYERSVMLYNGSARYNFVQDYAGLTPLGMPGIRIMSGEYNSNPRSPRWFGIWRHRSFLNVLLTDAKNKGKPIGLDNVPVKITCGYDKTNAYVDYCWQHPLAEVKLRLKLTGGYSGILSEVMISPHDDLTGAIELYWWAGGGVYDMVAETPDRKLKSGKGLPAKINLQQNESPIIFFSGKSRKKFEKQPRLSPYFRFGVLDWDNKNIQDVEFIWKYPMVIKMNLGELKKGVTKNYRFILWDKQMDDNDFKQIRDEAKNLKNFLSE